MRERVNALQKGSSDDEDRGEVEVLAMRRKGLLAGSVAQPPLNTYRRRKTNGPAREGCEWSSMSLEEDDDAPPHSPITVPPDRCELKPNDLVSDRALSRAEHFRWTDGDIVDRRHSGRCRVIAADRPGRG